MTTSTRGKFSRSRSSRPLPPSDSPIQRSARSMPTRPGGPAEQGGELLQRVQPREVAGPHRPGLLVGPGPLGAGVADHPHVGHAALGRAAPLALLPHAGGVQLDVGAAPAPRSPCARASPPAGRRSRRPRRPRPGAGRRPRWSARRSTPRAGRRPSPRAARPPSRSCRRPPRPGWRPAPGPGSGRGSSAPRRGRRGTGPCRSPAEVVGAAVADGPHEAEGGVRAVRVELGGPAAVRAGHAGPFVAVFFPARCRSTALAAILWARRGS